MNERLQLFFLLLCCVCCSVALSAQSSCSAPILSCSENTQQSYSLSMQTPVDFGNDYGCLDPWGPVGKSWNYVRTNTAGPVELVIQGSEFVGAAVWGPFTDLSAAESMCGTLPTPTDCDIVSDEFAFLNFNATTEGEVYLIFVMSESSNATFTLAQHNASDNNAGSVACTVAPPPPPPPSDCAPAAPLCGTYGSVHYPLDVSTPVSHNNAYGCLDPWGPKGKAWHYVEVTETGYLQFTIDSDGPFGAAIWGSFPDVAAADAACGSLTTPFDCENSNGDPIILGANATVVGEVFLILVISDASPSEFTFEQTNLSYPNSGAISCSNTNILTMTCAEDIVMSSCNDALPSAYPTYAEFYNAGGAFANACNGNIGLSDAIYYDNGGTGCAGDARQVVRQYYAADVCGNIAVCYQNIFYPESTHGPIPICPPTIGINCLDDINVNDHLSNTQIITDCGLGFTMTVIDSTFQGGNWGLECDFADYIYHVRVTDDCGRSADCELRYTLIGDAPVFEDDTHPHPDTCVLPPLVKECGSPFIDHDQLIEDWIDGMTVTGTCGQAVTVTTDYSEDNFVFECGMAGEQVVTFTAEDECGRVSTCKGSIINIDTKPPSFSTHATDITANCDEDVQAVFDAWLANHGGANGIDCCSEIIWSYLPEDASIPSPCAGNNAVEVTFVASDACGNSVTSAATFTVEGTAALSINVEANNMMAECSDDPVAAFQNWLANNGGASATACGAVTWATNPANPMLGGICGDAVEVTFIASDACGETVSTTGTFAIVDTEAPVLTTPDPELPFYGITATDNCDTDVAVMLEETQGSNECQMILTWTASDDCGNTSVTTYTVNGVGDSNPPTFDSVPMDMTMDCAATPAFGEPSASDVEGGVSITFEDMTTDGACGGTSSITRTWTATDDCGNTATASATITTEDTTAPVFLSIPQDLTFFCDEMIDFPQPTVSDDCGMVTITFTEELNDGAVVDDCNNGFGYDIFRTWIATDECGNSSTAETVAWVVPAGYTGPQFNFVPENRMIGCSETPTFGNAVCETFCGEVSMTYIDVEVIGDCAEETSYTRIWTGIDDCGNTATASQVLTIPVDTEAPLFTFVPENKTVACGESIEFGTPTCTDNCTGAIDHLNVSYEDIELSDECAFQRTWTVTDACGNMNQAVQKITLSDTDAPVLSAIPAEKVITCGQAFEFDMPTATDGCSQVEITFEETSENMDCVIGETRTRIYSATDVCGNVAVVTQSIRMEDNDAPQFTFIPEDEVLDCGAAYEYGEPQVVDGCSAVDITFEDIENYDACIGRSFQRVWTATDACGNASQAVQRFTSLPDDTAPTFSMTPANKVIACGAEIQFDNPAATDVCSGVEILFADETVDGTCENSYAVTRTWIAIDGCDNASVIQQTITVEDNEAPVFATVLEAKTVPCSGAVVFDTAIAEDACSSVELAFEDTFIAGNCGDAGTHRRLWTATDACGNAQTIVQEIIVEEDQTAPTLTNVLEDKTITCGESVVFDEPMVSDNCSEVSMAIEDTIDMTECTSTTTRTWTISDACGNATEVRQVIHQVDATAPEFVDAPSALEMTAAEFQNWIPTAPMAMDACNTVVLSDAVVEDNGDCANFKFTYTWTASDACGNAAEHAMEVRILDALPTVDVVLPEEIYCGENYPISMLVDGGLGTYTMDWAIDSEDDWAIDLSGEAPVLQSAEGAATLTLTMVNEYGCQVEETMSLACLTTSITNVQKAEGFTLAPNPTSHQLQLIFDAHTAADAEVIIYDMLGQAWIKTSMSYQRGTNTKTLDVSGLAASTYMVVIQTADTHLTQKFIKTE